MCKWKSARPTTVRKAGYAPDFYIIVSTAGPQAETTRAIEVNPDDYIQGSNLTFELNSQMASTCSGFTSHKRVSTSLGTNLYSMK